MAVIFFACCTRGKTRKKTQPDVENQVIPNEESRLLRPEPETPSSPDIVTQEREMRKARLVTIVRAKEGNMINTSDYAPFNILNRPYPYSPHRYSLRGSGSGRSLSRSGSRGPSHSVVRHGYPYGPSYANGYGSTLVNAVSFPAPLEPEPSEVQVQIASAALGTTSLERSASKVKSKAKENVQGERTKQEGQSGNSPGPHFSRRRPSLLPSSSSSSSVSSILKLSKSASPSGSESSPNLGEEEGKGTQRSSLSVGLGLGVRLVHPPPSSIGSEALNPGRRRGRPTMKSALDTELLRTTVDGATLSTKHLGSNAFWCYRFDNYRCSTPVAACII